MSGFLLDTNVISELVKPRPEANVTAWIEGTDESLLYLSVWTLGEIRRGIAILGHQRYWTDSVDGRSGFQSVGEELTISGACWSNGKIIVQITY